MLPRLIAYNTYMPSFQYKVLNDVLFLNKKHHTFKIKPSPLCSFCNLHDETPFHIFDECDRVECLSSDLIQCFQKSIILSTLTSKNTIVGILDSTSNDSIFKNNKVFINSILLIFKLYVYESRENKLININNLIAEIGKLKRIEKETALTKSKKKLLLQRNGT